MRLFSPLRDAFSGLDSTQRRQIALFLIGVALYGFAIEHWLGSFGTYAILIVRRLVVPR